MPEHQIRVLYSFPHKIGADRIAYTAWQQVNGLAAAGTDLLVFPGAVHRSLPDGVRVQPTLARGKLRIPYRALGRIRALAMHDYIVAQRLKRLRNQVDIVHAWPLGSVRTLETAASLGIPAVLERCNAHTRFAYEVVRDECDRLGVSLPPGHEHEYNDEILAIEEEEYRRSFRLLCPSEFVVQTFRKYGFSDEKLARHFYGYDESTFHPSASFAESKHPFTMLFVGVCAVRKGVHFALEAWLKSPAHRDGVFLIAGEFLPSYQQKLASMLAHPSVRVLGHRRDIPELMRQSDVLVLPSIEEGFGLVCTEAMGSGSVPLVSDACTDLCKHEENSLVHHVGDVAALSEHISSMYRDRAFRLRMRETGLETVKRLTWTSAGVRLSDVYRETIGMYRSCRGNQKPVPVMPS